MATHDLSTPAQRAARIRGAIAMSGMDIDDIARAAGIERRTLDRMKSAVDKRTANRDELGRIARATRVPEAFLVHGLSVFDWVTLDEDGRVVAVEGESDDEGASGYLSAMVRELRRDVDLLLELQDAERIAGPLLGDAPAPGNSSARSPRAG